jgi:hypothetical protein
MGMPAASPAPRTFGAPAALASLAQPPARAAAPAPGPAQPPADAPRGFSHEAAGGFEWCGGAADGAADCAAARSRSLSPPTWAALRAASPARAALPMALSPSTWAALRAPAGEDAAQNEDEDEDEHEHEHEHEAAGLGGPRRRGKRPRLGAW